MEQFDTLLPELTVREMLLYTAELKCPRAEPLPDKRARVERLLGLLALGGCAGTLIGDSLARGISGGQVNAPPILAFSDNTDVDEYIQCCAIAISCSRAL